MLGSNFEEYHKLEIDILKNEGVNSTLKSAKYWILEYKGEKYASMISSDAAEAEPAHLMPHPSKNSFPQFLALTPILQARSRIFN